MAKLKMAIIGGGSSYSPELVDGIIQNHSSLPVDELVLIDLPQAEHKLRTIFSLTERMVQKAGLNISVATSFDRLNALKECSYVITQFRVGGLEARAKDEKIPLEYGLLGQETTGAGGFAKALRTVPIALDIARDMEQVCPEAWLINFTNPSGLVTQAVNDHSAIRCIGLCNVPINMLRNTASFLNIPTDQLSMRFIGLNHLSFVDQVVFRSKNQLPTLLRDPSFIDHIAKYLQSSEGSKQLVQGLQMIPSPYLYYYYYEKEAIEKAQSDIRYGKGTRAQQVMAVEKDLFQLYEDPNLDRKPEQLSKRGGSLYSEAAISLISSIQNNLGEIHVVNVPNQGSVKGLPMDAVIETNCYVDQSGAHPLSIGLLPDSIAPLIQRAKQYETYTIEAAVQGCKQKAYLALLTNPLVHFASQIPFLMDALLKENEQYLFQFFTKEEE